MMMNLIYIAFNRCCHCDCTSIYGCTVNVAYEAFKIIIFCIYFFFTSFRM